MWFMSLGTFDKNAPTPTGEQHQILAPDTITAQTPYGELARLAPPVKFSETKPYWEDPVLVVRESSTQTPRSPKFEYSTTQDVGLAESTYSKRGVFHGSRL